MLDLRPLELNAMALEGYEGNDNGVLSFAKGDSAAVISQTEQGWWCVKLGSQIGWVPGEFWEVSGQFLSAFVSLVWMTFKIKRINKNLYSADTQNLSSGKKHWLFCRRHSKRRMWSYDVKVCTWRGLRRQAKFKCELNPDHFLSHRVLNFKYLVY